MHKTAMENGQRFFDTYVGGLGSVCVVDIGAQDVCGSLREVCPQSAYYVGVDFIKGKGVDIVLDDPYKLPFEDNTVDVIVSTSTFEHCEMFWLLFLEIIRVLKPMGLFYLNAPSHCGFHRFPVDCYRFFPDSGNALAKWARKCGFDETIVLEQYTNYDDYVCVFLKDIVYLGLYPNRILQNHVEVSAASAFPDLEVFLFGVDKQGKRLMAPQLGTFSANPDKPEPNKFF